MSNETRHDATAPGDRLVRLGVIVFGVGAVATLITVAPLFLGLHALPSAAYFVCMLMGVGFALAAAGLLRSIAAQRRAAAADGAHRPDGTGQAESPSASPSAPS